MTRWTMSARKVSIVAVARGLLLTTMVVIPLILLVPGLISMIHLYFYRIAEVVCLPFP